MRSLCTQVRYLPVEAILFILHTYLLIRDCAVATESVAEFDIAGVSVDAGMNVFHESGDCDGVFDLEEGSCEEFDLVDGIPLDYPFIPGDLSVYDEAAGLRLSTGLTARVLAKTGSPINLTSSEARSTHSGIPFLEAPDGAATFPLEDGGWIYMIDSDLQNKKGGSYAVIFDSYGEVRDFEPRLLDTTKNSNGGVTPWGSWISCEEYPNGQCYQVDPLGEREPEVTFLGEAEGGNYEGFVSVCCSMPPPNARIRKSHHFLAPNYFFLSTLRPWTIGIPATLSFSSVKIA
jgi:hypothetical protein